MGFLRRLFGGGEPQAGEERPKAAEERRAPAEEPRDAVDEVEDEDARYRALIRAEAVRLDDDLLQRQLRYADRAWVPPREGGERRADDGEGRTDEG